MTAAQIEAIISSLESRMGSGAGRERYGDREVQWSTASELVSRIEYFKAMLAEVNVEPRTRFIRMVTTSGY